MLLDLLDATQLLGLVHFRASVPWLIHNALLQDLRTWRPASLCSNEHGRFTLLCKIAALPGTVPLRERGWVYRLARSVAVFPCIL